MSEILDSGLKENRSALAFAAVKPWLTANPSESQTVPPPAAQGAEYAGDWTAAVSFYRKLLKAERLDARMAADAVPAVTASSSTISATRKPPISSCARTATACAASETPEKFDSWFLEQASDRKGHPRADHMAHAIHNANESIEPVFGQPRSALRRTGDVSITAEKNCSPTSDKLAAASRTTPAVKARIAWVKEIVPFAATMAEFVGAKKEVPDAISGRATESGRGTRRRAPLRGFDRRRKGLDAFQRRRLRRFLPPS